MQSHWLAFPRFQAEVWPSVTVVLRARAPGQACVRFPPLGRIGVHVACLCWFVFSCCFVLQSFLQISCSSVTFNRVTRSSAMLCVLVKVEQ